MGREKREDLERWTVHPRIHFAIQCLLALNFSFVRVSGFGLFDFHVGLVLSLASRASSSSVLEHDQAYGTRVLASTGKKRLHSHYDTS
jgi:hypothetical protein